MEQKALNFFSLRAMLLANIHVWLHQLAILVDQPEFIRVIPNLPVIYIPDSRDSPGTYGLILRHAATAADQENRNEKYQ